ncbi:MAG: HAMP domain-containing histidine kinase [Lachnospiraceae bacterium]|nr:HAMP domain-containing histidine kinase [Lachnospiraceae bacterium]
MLVWKISAILLTIFCLGLVFWMLRMKKQLRNIKEELEATRDKSYNRQLQVDLFDRDLTDMTAELNRNLDYQKQLKVETEKAEKAIRQSVSDIAHDLRTPLTVVKGNLQMLRMEESLSEKGKQYVELCAQKADEIREMADDFFQLSLLESDLEAVELKRMDLTEALLQFLTAREALIRTNHMEPEVIFPQKSIFVLADEKLLDRMLGNLLNNVFRHAKGDRFLIRLEEKEETVITFANEVEAPESLHLESLFERTYRGDKARSGNGAGLGLYIVKLLAGKQKATVSAAIKENKLEISVHLPLAK